MTYCICFGHSLWFVNQLSTQEVNFLRWNDVPHTSRRFDNNFHPVIFDPYRRVEKERKATNYCVQFGHSLWSANHLPAARG
ncbi:unnamed protein product [Heterotrigona itama]|uniref:Uncharacterized protein n=1 Tax=Heterotrigona itama TaxID=395501 RepID=A0A6V7HAT9_9HYME|nr:unnamed protein product [Heterotrigona itama]